MSDSFQCETPIALIIFRRYEATQKVLASLRQVKPRQIFVIGDAPRPHKAGEAEEVERTRQLIETIDWDCKIKTNFATENLGTWKRIPSGLDWVFQQVDRAIILEDDCIPDTSFFPFCQTLLERYVDEPRVLTITGNNFQFGQQRTPYSYYFSRIHHSWGWATWRRAWQYFDFDMTLWPTVRDEGFLRQLWPQEPDYQFWSNNFEGAYVGRIQSWDVRWTLACWLQHGLTITPEVNLVTNVGFDQFATHTLNPKNPAANLPAQSIEFPLKHPPCFIRQSAADNHTQQQIFAPRLPTRIQRRLARLWNR